MNSNRLLFLLFLGTVCMTILMRWHGAVLNQSHITKAGIVSLELAKTKERGDAVVQSWQTATTPNLVEHAMENTRLDFVYIFFYSLFFFTCCWKLSALQTGMLQQITYYAGVAALVAGLCDVVENWWMLQILSGNHITSYYWYTWLFASVKFLFLLAIITWLLITGAIKLIQIRRS